MEKETKNKDNQSPPSTCTTTAYPPSSTTAASTDYRDQPETKNPATNRETKRSKHCPTALWSGNSGFPFSFDPRYCNGVSTPEVTPKFGSFSLVTASTTTTTAAAVAEKIEKIADRKTKDEEEEEDGKRCIHQKRKIEEFMSGEFQEMDNFSSRTKRAPVISKKASDRAQMMEGKEKLDVPTLITQTTTAPASSQTASRGSAGKGSAGKGSTGKGSVGKSGAPVGPVTVSSGSKSGSPSAGSAHVSASTGQKRKDGSVGSERPLKTARREPSSAEGGDEVESPEMAVAEGEVLHLQEAFLGAQPKDLAWRRKFGDSIAAVPSLPVCSRLDDGNLLLGYGRGVLSRATFDPDYAILPEDSLTELRQTELEMTALFSIGLSHLEKARKAVSSHVRKLEKAAPSAEVLQELERLKLTAGTQEKLLETERNLKKAAKDEAGKVKAELAEEKRLRAADGDKYKNWRTEADKEHADALQGVMDAMGEKLKEVDVLKEKLAAAEKREAEAVKKAESFDARVRASYDAGAFHILRLHQLKVPEENRLTMREMLDWKNAFIFREDLRVMHPTIPYTERDILLFNEMEVAAGREAWVPPPKELENLLDLVAEYDAARDRERAEQAAKEQAEEDAREQIAIDSPLPEMPLEGDAQFELGPNDLLVSFSGGAAP